MPANASIFRAALWMIGAILAFSSMAIAGREAGARFDTFEIMAFRSVVGLCIMSIILTATGRWASVQTQMSGTHFLRNLFHFTGQNLWFFAVTVIPLAQVFALEFTSPIWVILLSPLLLGEKLTQPRVAAAVLGFVGILIVARPDPVAISPGLVAAACSAVFFALTMILTRRLTQTEATLTILFWLTLTQMVLGAIAVLYDGEITLPNANDLPWLILIGVAGLAAHYCITTALSLAPAAVVAPIDFARLPLIAVLGLWIYGESIDLWVLLGAAFIFAGNYINILSQSRSPLRG
jgi:drug/metabolite transporter (DMT)-like permease